MYNVINRPIKKKYNVINRACCVWKKNLNEKVNNEVFGLIPNVSHFMYNLIYRAFCVRKI